MRRPWALLLVLCAGCVHDSPVRPSAWLEAFKPFRGTNAADLVRIETALIERPLGDTFLGRDLWVLTDEQVIALERQAVLQDNGFRIAQIGGILPAALQELLTSPRGCIDPHHIQMRAGNARLFPIGPILPNCPFELYLNHKTSCVSFSQAQCLLEVTPTLTPDGRTRLQFTPRIQHGQPSLLPCPAADRSGWVRQEQRPTENYSSLGWEVTLAPNEYVLVSTWPERPGTLGGQFFLRPERSPPVQQVLVIRTNRPVVAVVEEEQREDEEPSSGKAASLAQRASMTCVRGKMP